MDSRNSAQLLAAIDDLIDAGHAEAALRVLAERFPDRADHAQCLRVRASALRHLGRTNEALEAAEAARGLAPTEIPVLLELAHCEDDAGLPLRAERTALTALGLDPLHHGALSMLGRARIDLGKLETALLDFERALEIHPECTGCLANRMYCTYHLGQTLRAEALGLDILSMEPGHAYTLAFMGNARFTRGDHEGAHEMLEAAAQIEPNNASVANELLAVRAARRGALFRIGHFVGVQLRALLQRARDAR